MLFDERRRRPRPRDGQRGSSTSAVSLAKEGMIDAPWWTPRDGLLPAPPTDHLQADGAVIEDTDPRASSPAPTSERAKDFLSEPQCVINH